ncbi:MAG: hypothetical protein V1493_02465 [Candidatus Diapherotrites archaeon]
MPTRKPPASKRVGGGKKPLVPGMHWKPTAVMDLLLEEQARLSPDALRLKRHGGGRPPGRRDSKPRQRGPKK